jgi:hypothetical protein
MHIAGLIQSGADAEAGGVAAGLLLAALPLAAYAGLFWVLCLKGEGWRSAAIGAATCWGVLLALITEILSLPRLITRPALALAWLTVTMASVGYGWVLRGRNSYHVESGTGGELQAEAGKLDGMDWFLLAGIGLLVSLVGMTGILSAPNTWDAMAYHMSRVAQWMVNRDVSLYPAFYSAQLFLGPWAEYAMLHLDVLYGGDRLVNLVELFSMVGTVIGVSLIAQRLGASRRGQIFAALACATIPEGVLEASGAMNTYVGAFWIVIAVYYVVRWNERQNWAIAVAIGSASGLAILTKGTAYVFLPGILLACWWMGSGIARKRLLAQLPLLLLIALVLNGPLFLRNYRLSGSPLGFASPLGDDAERQYANSRVSASVAFANVVKNSALHLGTPAGGVNNAITRAVVWTLAKFHIDPNDKASTYRGGFHLNGVSSHEARAGDPLQLVLIGIACLLLLRKRTGDRRSRLAMLGIGASFVLFCACIRWQPWNSRYHLPLIALGVAVAGVVIERNWPRVTVSVAACLLLVSAVPFALANSLRPIVPWPRASVLRQPRVDSYFADSHDWWKESYVAAANLVEASGCKNIGIDSSLEDFDYPMFALLDAGHDGRIVGYARVRNLTAAYVRHEVASPCAVICLRCANAPAKWAEYRDVGGRVSVFDEVAVFSREGNLLNNQTVSLPGPSQTETILRQLDHYRDSPRPVALGSVEDKIDRAGREWPDKKADLKARLNALYTGGLSLWRVRDSVDPMRRRGEQVDDTKIDPTQLLAAQEVFENWDQTITGRVEELSAMVDRLDSARAAKNANLP